MTAMWPYELRKAIVGYNQCVRAYRAVHGNRSVETDGRYVENADTPPRRCRWCFTDLWVRGPILLCPGCDLR